MIILFISLILIFTIEFPYYIEAPGGIIDLEDRIELDEKYETKGSFNLSYVSEIKATIPTLLYALVDKDWDIIKNEEIVYENETKEEADYRSHLLLKRHPLWRI